MNKQEVRALQALNSYPAISILMPTHRTSPENRQDPIRLKNLITETGNRLAQEFSGRDIAPYVDKMNAIYETIDFQKTLDGLALYLSDQYAGVFLLPFEVKERVVIDNTFATRDLVYTLNRVPRYWVLVLSEKPTRLYMATKYTLEEVSNTDFPMTMGGPDGVSELPSSTGVSGSAYRGEYHRQFFRAVDEAYHKLAVDDPLPLAVVGVDRYLSFYREVCKQPNNIISTLQGSHDKTSPHELGKLVWDGVKDALAKQREEAVQKDLEAAKTSRKFVSGIGEVWRAAHDGRGDLLIVEEGYHVPARVDDSGRHITLVDDPTEVGVIDDAVDEVIEMMLQKGGRVRFVDDGTLPEHQRITVLLRY